MYQPREKGKNYQQIIFLHLHEALDFFLSAKNLLSPKKLSLQENAAFRNHL